MNNNPTNSHPVAAGARRVAFCVRRAVPDDRLECVIAGCFAPAEFIIDSELNSFTGRPFCGEHGDALVEAETAHRLIRRTIFSALHGA